MKKKRLLITILVVAFVAIFALSGCKSGGTGGGQAGGTTPDKPATTAPATTAPTGGNPGPNANADGSANLDKIANYDPDFDYTSSGKQFKMKYLTQYGGALYEDFSNAFAHWAGKMNIQYDGIWSNQDNDVYLQQIQTCADQGYDGILIDPDTTIYPAILDILNANPQMQWMAGMAPARDLTLDTAPLVHPTVGFGNYDCGRQFTVKLLEYAKKNWPDVPLDKIGVIEVDFSVVPALHDRYQGAFDQWVEETGLSGNFFQADCVAGGMGADPARDEVMPLISTHSEFTNWLIAGCFDDYALGAAAAVDSLGLNDKACIVTMGGSSLIQQWDAGQETPFRYAYFSAQNMYGEPIMGSMYAFMAGLTTPDKIWPDWININDCGGDGGTYASLQLPIVWLDHDNYKHYLAWTDIYAGANAYPNYSHDGIERDSYSVFAEVPNEYKVKQ